MITLYTLFIVDDKSVIDLFCCHHNHYHHTSIDTPITKADSPFAWFCVLYNFNWIIYLSRCSRTHHIPKVLCWLDNGAVLCSCLSWLSSYLVVLPKGEIGWCTLSECSETIILQRYKAKIIHCDTPGIFQFHSKLGQLQGAKFVTSGCRTFGPAKLKSMFISSDRAC